MLSKYSRLHLEMNKALLPDIGQLPEVQVRQLTVEEIAQAETQEASQNPPETPHHCRGWTPKILHWKNHWQSSENITHIYGTPALQKTDRITKGVFRLLPNSVRLHFDVNKHEIQWTDQSSRWGTSTGGQVPRAWENNLEYTHIVQPLEILLTNSFFVFDNKLYHQTFGALCARSHYPNYVTYGRTKSWNSCPKTQHTRTKSTLMPVSEMMGTWYGRSTCA